MEKIDKAILECNRLAAKDSRLVELFSEFRQCAKDACEDPKGLKGVSILAGDSERTFAAHFFGRALHFSLLTFFGEGSQPNGAIHVYELVAKQEVEWIHVGTCKFKQDGVVTSNSFAMEDDDGERQVNAFPLAWVFFLSSILKTLRRS